MMSGDKIYLRAVELQDLEQLMNWRNIPEFKKNFREYRELNIEMQKKWFNNFVIDDKNTIMFTICNINTNEIIGCCGLCYINWIYRYSDLSLYIGKDESYIDDEGYALEACKLLFDYGFNQINLNKIWTEIYEFDIKKEKLYLSLGFNQDGLLRQNYFYDGKWWNSKIMSLLCQEYKL